MTEKGWDVRAILVKFGREPGLDAVWAGLLRVRRADRDVQSGVRVAESGGEDVAGPEVGARNEARNLCFGSVVTRLSSGVNLGGELVVAAGGLTQGTAGGVSGSRVQGARAATARCGRPPRR